MLNEQSIKQWASLVMEEQVESLSEIQSIDFASKLFYQIDKKFFDDPAIKGNIPISFLKLFEKIGNYYAKQIGINIRNLISELNVYTEIMEVWELALGIAIKGKNRQKNINIILKMDPKAQQELMRVVSNINNKLGQNVSNLENQSSSQIYVNESNLLIELTEENQVLKQKVDQLSEEMNGLRTYFGQQEHYYESELQNYKKERFMVFDLFEQSKCGIKLNGNLTTFDLVRDLLIHVKNQNMDMDAKEEKVMYLEEMNKNVKLAYSGLVEEMKNKQNEKNIKEEVQAEKEIEGLREENIQYEKREQKLIKKIEQLQESKFYLKSIIARLQKKTQPEKNSQLESQYVPSQSLSPSMLQSNKTENKEGKELNVAIQENKSSQQTITVKREINEVQEPSLKNKLQREISHLKNKLSQIQEKNKSLIKINSILEKSIENFTKQNKELIFKYEKKYQVLAKETSQLIFEAQRYRENEKNEMAKVMEELKSKIHNLMEEKIHFQSNQPTKPVEVKEKEKIQNRQTEQKENHSSNEEQPFSKISQIKKSVIKVNLPEESSSSKSSSSYSDYAPQIIISTPAEETKPPIPSEKPVQQQKPSSAQNQLIVGEKIQNSFIMNSFIEDEEEIQPRKREYSFMRKNQIDLKISNLKMMEEKQFDRFSQSKIDNFQQSKLFEEIEEMEEKEESAENEVQILDITKIEEDLTIIKDKYKQINEKYHKFHEEWKQLQNKRMKKEVKELKSQQLMLNCPQQIVNLQNAQLKEKVKQLKRERDEIYRKVHTYRGKEKQKIYNLVQEINELMTEKEGYFQTVLIEQMAKGLKQNTSAEGELLETKQKLLQAQTQIKQLNMQIDVLSSAMLEMRVCWLKRSRD